LPDFCFSTGARCCNERSSHSISESGN